MMKKGQSLIIEFILFFLISFSIFAVISSFFYNQNEFFKEIIGDRLTNIVNDLVSTHIIKGASCRSCDFVLVSEDLPSKIGGYYYRVYLGNQYGINTTLMSGKLYSGVNPLFNLNETFDLQDSQSGSENKMIGIRINNIDKGIVIE